MTRTIRRLILGAGIGLLAALALSTAAHADDKPAAAVSQQPGGLLDTAEDVVDEVAPTPEPEPEPTKEPEPPAAPEPEPSTEPSKEPDRTDGEPPQQEPTAPADEPAQAPDETAGDEPATEVPPVEVPVTPPPVVVTAPPVEVVVPPVVIEVPPVVAPTPVSAPAPQQPVVQPPTPADEPNDTPPPLLAQVVTPPVTKPEPTDLPVTLGPIAATETQPVDDGIYPPGTLPDPAPPVADCDDHNHQPDEPGGDQPVTQQTSSKRQPDTIRDKPRRGKPCPGGDSGPGPAITTLTVKPPPPTGEQLVADTVACAYSDPVLHRLGQLRARSTIPAGRTVHPEPGPA